MSLSNPPLSEVNLEHSADLLWREWLGAFFDGGSHLLGSGVVFFPKAVLGFGQGPVQQPLDQTEAVPASAEVEIRLVSLPAGAEVTLDHADQKGSLVMAPVNLNFWVRANRRGAGQGEYLCRQAADRLHGLLKNPTARLPLAEKGICELRPRKAQPIENTDWHQRLVVCGANYHFRAID